MGKKFEKNIAYIFAIVFFTLGLLVLFCDYFENRVSPMVVFLIFMGFLPWMKYFVSYIKFRDLELQLNASEKMNEMDAYVVEIVKHLNEDQLVPLSNEEIEKIIDYSDNKANFGMVDNIIKIIDENVDVFDQLNIIKDEIEKFIVKLSRQNDSNHEYSEKIEQLVSRLVENKIITLEISKLILNILELIEKINCQRNDNYNKNDLEWIINKGKIILLCLERKCIEIELSEI